MYLRFENDIPIYSLNESELKRLNKIIEEIDRPKDYILKLLFQDSTTIKILDAIFQYYYMDGIKIEYPKELEFYLENKFLFHLFTMAIFQSDYKISSDSTIKKYKFTYSTLNNKVSVLYSTGVLAQLNIANSPINLFGSNLVQNNTVFR